jgi:hypothetical protein
MEADERTRAGLQYDLFSAMIHKIESAPCVSRAAGCDIRFKRIETVWAKVAGALVLLSIAGPWIMRLIMR